jgi:anthranilate phosphoribosyltransferase
MLGTRRAWVVHGRDGLDEITLCEKTDIISLEQDGTLRSFIIDPKEFGFAYCQPSDLKGGSADHNAEALMTLLRGHKSAYRDIVLLNAAAVLMLHGRISDLRDGIQIASEAIDSSTVFHNFIAYRDFSEQCHE